MKVDPELAVRPPNFVRMVASIRSCRSGCCTIFAETRIIGHDISGFYTLVSLLHAQADMCMGLDFDVFIFAWIFAQSADERSSKGGNAWHGGPTLKMISSSKENLSPRTASPIVVR